MGDTKGGPFDIDAETALRFLKSPNPHGQPNSDVVFPWWNGMDVTRRARDMWIIDFPLGIALDEAVLFEAPFAHLEEHVRKQRLDSRSIVKEWWIHERPRVEMRDALSLHPAFICTPIVSKHRLFVWTSSPILPDHQLVAFARSDDYFFGVLHSRSHELWGLKLGTRLTTRPRYTATTCFETFPFPEPTDAQRTAIADAARELDRLRNNWLNPPEWTTTEVLEFPGTVGGPWDRYIDRGTIRPIWEGEAPAEPLTRVRASRLRGSVALPNDAADSLRIGMVKYPRTVPRDEASAKELKKRTLTNLYNERPTWLDLAYRRLDEAVFAAYGWTPAMSDDELLARLLELNLQRAAAEKGARRGG